MEAHQRRPGGGVNPCPTCGARCVSHCPDHDCGWWKCTVCWTYGDRARVVADKRKRQGDQ